MTLTSIQEVNSKLITSLEEFLRILLLVRVLFGYENGKVYVVLLEYVVVSNSNTYIHIHIHIG